MKIFHTADWHLGKIIHGTSMLEDQAYMLEQFIQKIQDEKPDLVIIAGDLYDRANPPTEAVELLNNFLDEVVLTLKVPVMAIAGNHDSPIRLQFGSNLMRERGFFISGSLEETIEPIILNDSAGEVHFYLVPFVDPSVVRTLYEDDSVRNFDDALSLIIQRIEKNMNPKVRNVLITHYFVTPKGEPKENTSDSERILSVGGIEYVNAKHFEAFDYVALGHLHRAHAVGKSSIRYAGSPLKYSKSEENHEKGFYEVNLEGDHSIQIEKRSLRPRRDLRTVKATIAEILQMDKSEDYIFVELLDRGPVLSPMEQIRTVFPNTLHLERPFDQQLPGELRLSLKEKEEKNDVELFQSFYEEVRGFPPEAEIMMIFKEVIDEFLNEEHNE